MKTSAGPHKSIYRTAIAVLLCILSLGMISALAQQGPAHGKLDQLKDPEMEVSAKHDLEVANWYIYKRKAYEGARDRLQEILDTYPDFSKIDEVIFLMGEVNHKLSKDGEAAKYYNRLIKEYPGSRWVKKAKEALPTLKPEAPEKAKDSADGEKKPDNADGDAGKKQQE